MFPAPSYFFKKHLALPLAPDHSAFALLAFSIVLVWLAAWVGLFVVPVGALHASGSSTPVALVASFVVMLSSSSLCSRLLFMVNSITRVPV